MAGPIQLIATLYPVDKDKAERIKELISAVAEKVKANEPGVSRYRLNEQITSKGTPLLVMTETYDSDATIAEHGKTPYFQEFVKTLQKEQLVSKPMSLLKLRGVAGYDSRL